MTFAFAFAHRLAMHLSTVESYFSYVISKQDRSSKLRYAMVCVITTALFICLIALAWDVSANVDDMTELQFII